MSGKEREEFVGVHNKCNVGEGIRKIYDECVKKEIISPKEVCC